MKRLEERFLSQTPRLSVPAHQQGNVNAFMLAMAFVIASMWLMFDNSAAQRGNGDAMVPSVASYMNLRAVDTPAALPTHNGEPVAELVVTAPRLVNRAVTFERPEKDTQPAEPVAPKAFWQSPS